MKDYVTSLGGLAVAAFVYANSASFAVSGAGLAKDPAYYPRMLAFMLAALALLLLIRALGKREKPQVHVNKMLLLNVGMIFGLILVYILAFQYIGFIVSTLAFIVCGILIYGGGLKSALICGASMTAGVYIVFHILMNVPMPNGLLF